MSLLIDNPIAYAQFAIRGGWKQTLGVAGVYVVMLGGLIFVTANASYNPARTLASWVTGLLVIQAALLLLLGASRVSGSIRRDVTQQMLESHRLMPVGGVQAVVGYLIGAGGQALVMTAATILLGTIVAQAAGASVLHFVTASVALLQFSVFVWIVGAFAAFVVRGGFALLAVVMVLGMVSGGIIVSLLPAMKVLLALLFDGTIFNERLTPHFLPWSYVVTSVSQLFIATICVIGAARKYRSGEDAALGPLLGLATAIGWAAISAAGLVGSGAFDLGRDLESVSAYGQFIAALFSTMLLAIVPVASAAWHAVTYARHQQEQDPQPMRRPPALPVVIAIATLPVLGLAMLTAVGDMSTWSDSYRNTLPAVLSIDRLGLTAIVVGAFLVSIGYLQRWVYLAVPNGKVIGGLWLALSCFLPLIIDFAVAEAQGNSSWSEHDPVIAGISPIGALMMIWDTEPRSYGVGVLVQVVLAIAIVALSLSSRNTRPAGEPVTTEAK